MYVATARRGVVGFRKGKAKNRQVAQRYGEVRRCSAQARCRVVGQRNSKARSGIAWHGAVGQSEGRAMRCVAAARSRAVLCRLALQRQGAVSHCPATCRLSTAQRSAVSHCPATCRLSTAQRSAGTARPCPARYCLARQKQSGVYRRMAKVQRCSAPHRPGMVAQRGVSPWRGVANPRWVLFWRRKIACCGGKAGSSQATAR